MIDLIFGTIILILGIGLIVWYYIIWWEEQDELYKETEEYLEKLKKRIGEKK